MVLFWLLGGAWTAIGPPFPMNQPNASGQMIAAVISGILHALRVGRRTRDCLAEHGPFTRVCNRVDRWSRRGSCLTRWSSAPDGCATC